jgi:pyruvate dehydrogenase kinase 2/3/4
MILFGQNPSQGTLLKASQFLSEELPIRLSHRITELDGLPDGLSKMPSIEKVKEWYAQSFEVSTGCAKFTCHTFLGSVGR